MEDYQKRVIEERDELDARLSNLRKFIASPAFEALSREDASLLAQQASKMMDYVWILEQRIARFK